MIARVPFARSPLAPACLALLASLALAGCTSSGSNDGILDGIMFGPTGAPPLAAAAGPIPVEDCPPVTVGDGGAALRAIGSGEGSVRSQISIADVARECTGRPDGAVLVKVGIRGRVLLGPGGTPGRFDAPITIVLKRGEQVLARRVARTAVVIQPGTAEQSFVVVEDGLAVPPGTGEFDIEVSLGAAAAAGAPRPRGRA